MTTLSPQTEAKLRQGFKYFNQFMLLLWRLGLGKDLNAHPETSGRVMVLVHTGRKTGQRRTTPVNYALVDNHIYVTAGFGEVAHWYQNILANPKVEVWLPEGWWAGTAEDVSTLPERLPLLRQVLIGSGVVAPMIGIDPKTMSDTELDAATRSYKLVRIRRTEARTGQDGPGDLVWVWPRVAQVLLLAVLVLLPLAQRRQRR